MENIGRGIESIHITMDRETYAKIRSKARALALPISAFVRMTMVEALREEPSKSARSAQSPDIPEGAQNENP